MMGKTHRRQREYSAGAFLNPFTVPIAAAPRTLSDDYDDTPPPEETDEVPEPSRPVGSGRRWTGCSTDRTHRRRSPATATHAQ